MIGSFYDPDLEEGCAFEELISFHGGIGGPQTQAFILYPGHLPAPPDPIIGAAAVHRTLWEWRRALQGDTTSAQGLPAETPVGLQTQGLDLQ
jgi:hypothetical protein